MKRTWITALTAAIIMAGCGDSETEAPEESAAPSAPAEQPADDGGNPFLDAVDAGTAYVYANTARLPEAVSEKMWALNESGAAGNRAMLESLAEDEEMPPEGRALIEEITGLTTREGWTAAGLHENPYYAFYGVQLLPFAQFELSDGDAFTAFLARIEEGVEQPFQRRQVEDAEIVWIEIEPGFGIALHHDRDSVTVAAIPEDAALLTRVAGRYEPPEAMGRDALDAFSRESGFSSHGSGYIDWKRVVDGLLAEDTALAALVDDEEFDAVASNPDCVAEYGAVVDALPRMTFGYTRLTTEEMDFLVRQETSPALAEQIAPIAQAPVSLDRELSGLFSFGMAIDIIAAREFARSLVDGWVADPPKCPSFADLAAQAPELQENLNRPIPPVVTNIHGLYLEAMDLQLGENGVPTGGGTLTFFMENPQLVVGMAQMFSPAVAELQLEPGGEPLPVPEGSVPQLEQLGLEAWIAMGESALGVAIGEDHVDALSDGLDRTESDAFMMAGRFDFAMMTDLLDMAESALEDMAADEEAAAGLAAQREQYRLMAELYEQAGFKVRLSERGIEFVGESTLK
jgi:hypothetical protein